ncbi:pyridoxamine 5'-phosphate oxidase [Desulforhopalus vacuolatus]|uniref:pyridoxamine 5'-phosphate oxidase n=1 Tax=Desulforhopalus vacuolatus TaxID=40414 RepID=UPI001964F532|nr:pyridoxamine 5'-phosphate oxidase [Desulforhopalus vacuolatus]MBM9518249.1 pyridoxamine 5'-phosphate oxidase [Desulforhopalus vacuolatus]
MDLGEYRRDYVKDGLSRKDLVADPMQQFSHWFAQALELSRNDAVSMPDPTAVVVATVGENGMPSQRTVLLKFYDTRGFVFYTNYGSRKAREIAGNPQTSLIFVWLEMERQVRVCGRATKVGVAESTKYILSRPKESQMSAWVSSQSKPLTSRQALLQKLDEMKRKIGEGKVPIPSFWGGFRVEPQEIEFWQGGSSRLHDRFQYVKKEGLWQPPVRLAP